MTTVLITGANRGIGLEFVKQYAGDGWRVLACCRAPDAAGDLRLAKGDIEIFKLDLNDSAAAKRLAASIEEPIDLVIANAGVGGWGIPSFGDFDYDGWADVMKVNLFGAVSTLEAFAPHVKKTKGKLAAISSRMGSIEDASSSFAVPYRTSKAALDMAMKCIALEMEPAGVAVGVLHPGWVQTDLGGPNALIATSESVSGLRQVIEKMKVTASPVLTDYAGNTLPW